MLETFVPAESDVDTSHDAPAQVDEVEEEEEEEAGGEVKETLSWKDFQSRLESDERVKSEFDEWFEGEKKGVHADAYIEAQKSLRQEYDNLQARVENTAAIYKAADQSLRTLHGIFRKYENSSMPIEELAQAMADSGVADALQALSGEVVKAAVAQAVPQASIDAGWRTLLNVVEEGGKYLKDIPLARKHQEALVQAGQRRDSGTKELHDFFNDLFEAGVRKGASLKAKGDREKSKAAAREGEGPDTSSSSEGDGAGDKRVVVTAKTLRSMTPAQITKLKGTPEGMRAYEKALREANKK